jgi:diacylglycerol kinase (ATP)
MNVRVIVNPSSGRQIVQKQVANIIKRLVDDNTFKQVDVIRTTGKGDAYKAACDFQPWQVDLVMAVGGDGTVNEIVNGLIDGKHQTPLAILPAGTVNDFAYSMGIPRDTAKYCKMLREFKTVWADVGQAGSHYFLNVAAGGILTDVAYKTPSEAKTVLGQLAYVINGALDLPTQLLQTVPVRFKADDREIEDEIMLFIVSNTSSVGGFRNLATAASVSDGLLDVTIVHRMKWYDFLQLMVQLMNGEHHSHKGISYFQTRKLEITCLSSCNVPLDLDGEQGDTLPVTIRTIPGAIRLVIP